MTIGSLGVIDVNQWNTKAPPSPPVGFKWKNEGKVILIPSDKFIPNYEYDSNTITEDHQNYEKLYANIINDEFVYDYEPGYVIEGTCSELIKLLKGTTSEYQVDEYSGISARTRAKVFQNTKQPDYPVRILMPLEGYELPTIIYNAAVKEDLRRPSRTLGYKQHANNLFKLKKQQAAWYPGQRKITIDGNKVYTYGEEELRHWFFKVMQLNFYFHESIATKIWNLVNKGFNSTQDLRMPPEKDIKTQVKDHVLGNGADGFKVAIVNMGNPSANAPAKVRTILRSQGVKTRHFLFTTSAQTADEVESMRTTWRNSLVTQAEENLNFAFDGIFPGDESLTPQQKAEGVKSRKQIEVDAKIKEFFDNFELYSYNHIMDEDGFIKIEI